MLSVPGFACRLVLGAALLIAPVAAMAAGATNGLDTPTGVGSLPLSVEGSTIMTVTHAGVGINNATPAQSLDVNGNIAMHPLNGAGGSIQLSTDSTTPCNASNAGSIRYNGNGTFEGCNGATWGSITRPPPNKTADISLSIANACTGVGNVIIACHARTDASGNIQMYELDNSETGASDWANTRVLTVFAANTACLGGALKVYQSYVCVADSEGMSLGFFNASETATANAGQQYPSVYTPWN